MTGIGKTTLAAYVAKTAIKNGMFDNTFLVHQPEDSNEIRNAIAIASEGKSLVCLDGLDEWSAKLQAELSEIISSFFHTPEGHIIITSKSIPRWGDWSRQTHIIELAPLTLQESKELLKRLLNKIGKESQKYDLEKVLIESNNILSKMHGHPLTIRMLADLVTRYGGIDQYITSGPTLPLVMESQFRTLSVVAKEVLIALSLFEIPVTTRILQPLVVDIKDEELSNILKDLVHRGFVLEADGHYQIAHLIIKEYVRMKKYELPPKKPPDGKLVITFDPAVIQQRDVIEILSNLDQIYQKLSGDELKIDFIRTNQQNVKGADK